jgi:hypothetical protein
MDSTTLLPGAPVTIDGILTARASYLSAYRWNGWQCPYFDRAAVDSLIAQSAEHPESLEPLSWSDDRRSVLSGETSWRDGHDDADVVRTDADGTRWAIECDAVEIDGTDYWPLGGMSWVWSVLEYGERDGVRYLVTVDDPNYSPSDIREQEHVFLVDTLEEARSLVLAMDAGHGDYAQKLNGETVGMAQFGFLSAPVLTLWAFSTEETPDDAWQAVRTSEDPYPDYRVQILDGVALVEPC